MAKLDILLYWTLFVFSPNNFWTAFYFESYNSILSFVDT
jgi:hypothetical protein